MPSFLHPVEEFEISWKRGLTNGGSNDIIAERFAGDRGERKSLEKSFEKNEKSSWQAENDVL